MRVEKEHISAGYFWLPSNREKRIPGTVFIKNGGDIELEIIGNFKNDFPSDNDVPEVGRIIGQVEGLGLITLEDCFYRNRNYSFGGISKCSLYVDKLLTNVEYELNEPLSFESVTFSCDGLEEWIGISGITLQHKHQETSTLYKMPEPLIYALEDEMSLKVNFGYNMSDISTHPINFSISQTTSFRITSTNAKPLEDFISLIHKINNFMSFAMDDLVSIKNVFCCSNQIIREANGQNNLIPLKLFYRSFSFTEKVPKLNWHHMLFRFTDIKDRFDVVLNKWLEAYENISPSLNLYFANKVGAHKYLDGQFLALAQALETYHRRTSDETYIAIDAFKALVKEIKQNCPPEHKSWLTQRIHYGNEISLRTRLIRIIESFKDSIGTDEEIELIINYIVNTRNYFTHYDSSLEKKAASGQNLWNLCQKMEAILQLHLLKQLGFKEIEINHVLDKAYNFKNKLQNSKITLPA